MTEFGGYLWSEMSSVWTARSPDGGTTWEELPNIPSGRANDWAVLDNRLYMAGSPGVSRWNEAEHIWELLVKGLPYGGTPSRLEYPYVYALAVRDGQLYAGLAKGERVGGVYVLDSSTDEWSPVGLQEESVISLYARGTTLFAGTFQHGIFRSDGETVVAVELRGKATTTWAKTKRDAIAPDYPSLLPNYPNPFNPETWIPYELSEPADVMLTIYDARGTVVRALDVGRRDAGYYHERSSAAYWDGRNQVGDAVASGVYFVELRAGSYRGLRRLVVRK